MKFGTIRFRTEEPDYSEVTDTDYDWSRSVYVGYDVIPVGFRLVGSLQGTSGSLALAYFVYELFEMQREAILQWTKERVSRRDLDLPGQHLNACEIIESMPYLNEQAAITKQSKVVQPAVPVHSRSQDGT